MVYIKFHESGQRHGNRTIIAICDEDLIGKEFEENNLQLIVSERFYKGEIKPDEEILEIIKDATNVNFVGKKSVELGIKSGLITEENIIKIQGVPHAQYTTFTS